MSKYDLEPGERYVNIPTWVFADTGGDWLGTPIYKAIKDHPAWTGISCDERDGFVTFFFGPPDTKTQPLRSCRSKPEAKVL